MTERGEERRGIDRAEMVRSELDGLDRIATAMMERTLPSPMVKRLGSVVGGKSRVIRVLLPPEIPEEEPTRPPVDEPDIPPTEPGDPDPSPPPPTPPPPTPGGPAFEGTPFVTNGAYWWLQDSYNLDVFDGSIHDSEFGFIGEAMPLPVNSMNSNALSDLTGRLDGARVVGTSAFSTATNQFGPKWYQRQFNAVGKIEDLVVWRAGDFVKGREGHVLYLNAASNQDQTDNDLHIKNFAAIQAGAQAIQLVWRDGTQGHSDETGLPTSLHPQSIAGDRIVLENVMAIDCGVINLGVAVRASHPFSIFNPGHDELQIDGMVVRCDHAQPFKMKANDPVAQFNSHGVLLTGSSPWNFKLVEVRGLDVDINRPDRPAIRAHGVDEFRLVEGQMRVKSGLNQIDLWNTCKRFEIMPEFDWSGTIKKTIRSYSNGKWSFRSEFQSHLAGQHTVITN